MRSTMLCAWMSVHASHGLHVVACILPVRYRQLRKRRPEIARHRPRSSPSLRRTLLARASHSLIECVRLRDLATVSNDDGLRRLARLAADGLDRLDDFHATGHRSENDVLAVQPVRLHGAQEELRAIGARAGVGHGQDARAGVLQLEVLVGELGAVDGLAAGAVAGSEVTALAHELRDHAVEGGALVAKALLARAERAEVLSGLRHNVVAQGHLDAARRGATNGHVEENNGSHGYREER
mmetsp:Transcript_53675/g.138760  ORF Transcript_53675/g.138760 Transcript_53675/m.138760 type:complete len:239 (-) Transcript_53675:38-754(-)